MQYSSNIATATRTDLNVKKVKGHPKTLCHGCSIPVFSIKAFLVLEKMFKCVLPYMDMAAILFNSAEPLNKLTTPLRQKAPVEIW